MRSANLSDKRVLSPIYKLLLLSSCVLLISACSKPKSTVESALAPTPTIDRLAVPPLSENPSQLEHGTFIYKQVCMACHGDFGQGLTEEWRQEWDEDYNCWQSECHSASHPPWGFEIPTTCCPAVSGAGTLMRFDTAAELFTYLTETMPWWSPGNRSIDEYWALTAYLLDQNGALPPNIEINPGNALVIQVRPSSPPPGNVLPITLLLVTAISLAAILLGIQNRWFYRSTP